MLGNGYEMNSPNQQNAGGSGGAPSPSQPAQYGPSSGSSGSTTTAGASPAVGNIPQWSSYAIAAAYRSAFQAGSQIKSKNAWVIIGLLALVLSF